MSARQYFALRNTIPGYAFILIFIAINHVPLMEILQKPGFSDFFGAFLAFFYLLSGGAIGFLISQGWWWYWQGPAGILDEPDYKQAVVAFERKYYLVKPKIDIEKRVFVAAMDYAVHAKIDESTKTLLKVAERRWDMFHTLASTKFALGSGLVIALLTRGVYHLILWKFTIPCPKASIIELLALTFISISAIALLYFLKNGKEWSRQSSASLHEALIRSSKITSIELGKAFPRLYYNSKKSSKEMKDSS